MVGEKQAEDTRKQILRAQSANLAAGRPHGKLLYGYRIIRDDRGKSRAANPTRNDPC